MNEIVNHDHTGQSPFDAIKRTNERGEYWSARDLMPLLGYDKWERFADAVNRARQSMSNVGTDPERNASRLREPSGRTNQMREDFHLTRYACYLVAMNGDARKPEVAAAQAYFAIRTREAETGVLGKMQAGLVTRADLARMILEAEEEKAVLAAALKSAEPMIEYHDRYVADNDVIVVKVWGQQFDLGQKAAYQLLMDKKLIYRHSLGRRWSESAGCVKEDYEYRPYSAERGFFDLRPQHNAPRHHNGQIRQTLYVRQEQAIKLAKRCGLSVTEVAR